MDGQRFDRLTRALARGVSRRSILGGLAGSAAGLLGLRTGDAACGPEQIERRGVCLCKTSGRPPDEEGSCPCRNGQLQCGGYCADCCADTDCDDDNPCTINTCREGRCPHEAVVCPPASDQCLVAICDRKAGGCIETPAENGTPCHDGDACTQSDACDGAGSCIGSDPVVCTASDQCHDVGTCDPATGLCSDPAKVDDTECDDGDLCTENDACQAGACVGEPIVCEGACETCGGGVCEFSCGTDETCVDNVCCAAADICMDEICCAAGTVCAFAGHPLVDGSAVPTCCPPSQTTCLVNENSGLRICCDEGETCTTAEARLPAGGFQPVFQTCCPAASPVACIDGWFEGTATVECCDAGSHCGYTLIGASSPVPIGVGCCPADAVICSGFHFLIGDVIDICCPSGDTCVEIESIGPSCSSTPNCLLDAPDEGFPTEWTHCAEDETCAITDKNSRRGICCPADRLLCESTIDVPQCCGEDELCVMVENQAGLNTMCCPPGHTGCATSTGYECCPGGQTCTDSGCVA